MDSNYGIIVHQLYEFTLLTLYDPLHEFKLTYYSIIINFNAFDPQNARYNNN